MSWLKVCWRRAETPCKASRTEGTAREGSKPTCPGVWAASEDTLEFH